MPRSQWHSVAIVILRLLITFVFGAAIIPKFQQPAMWARLFTAWGHPAWGPLVVSTVEIIGLAALWIPAIATWGSVALLITTAGATGTWLLNGPRIAAVLPGVLFALVVTLAWRQRARTREASGHSFGLTH